MAAGDDAFDIALDTREVLADSILGPLARGALERVAPGLDPEEAIPPITRGLFGLPSPLAVPKLERIYFRCCQHCLTFALCIHNKRCCAAPST